MLAFICAIAAEPSDREFMMQLYLDYERLMYATAQKYVSDPEAVQDVVQESLLRLIPKVPFLREQEECIYVNYIAATVRNTAINTLRKLGVRSSLFCSLEDQAEHVSPEPGPSPEESLLRAEQREELARLWDRLREEDRLLLEGKYILGCRDAELADTLGCKESSIRMKLTRARRRALRLITEEGGEQIDEERAATGVL